MTETYTIRATSKTATWEITKFVDNKEPESVYQVSSRNGHFHCTCPGFYRQVNKDEHKHIQLVKFWKENLGSEPGFALWQEEEDIEYFKFLPSN